MKAGGKKPARSRGLQRPAVVEPARAVLCQAGWSSESRGTGVPELSPEHQGAFCRVGATLEQVAQKIRRAALVGSATKCNQNLKLLEKQIKLYSWFSQCPRYCLECVIQVTWISCSVFFHAVGRTVGTAESKSAGTQGCCWDHSQAHFPSSPGGCWQPASGGLGAKRPLSATAALETRSSKRLGWGCRHPSKD